ncbi:MAG: reactive intermediate/imine deaminase [Planctomycetes bacterium]|jgi:2-iminobutanoate/2-iminopropanoate deaminase|nr:reactive intermediate/imine deaminase [Planctomycetota bacterium]MDP6424820.1 Rid family detoxifying hydrolase [Planctomycetota bacterium]
MKLALALVLCLGACAAPAKQVISTDRAPAAIGPYSQAIRVGNTVWCAGQIAIDPATGKMATGIEAQTERVLYNIEAVLAAAGTDFDNVVQVIVFLADLNDYAAMNRIYAARFKNGPPARAAVQAARLPKDALVEIMVTAVR